MGTSKARVLVLIKGLGIGGAEKLISEAPAYWDQEKYLYRVAYLLPWKDQLVPDLESAGIRVDQVGNGKLGPATYRAFKRLLGDFRPDLVHAHLPSTGILARMASPAPVVYTEHNVVSSYREPTKTANRLTYGRNARIIAVSDAVAESVAAYPGPEALVIPNGVSVSVSDDEVAKVRDLLGIDEDTVLISHVGNIRPHKGHSNLIAAVARLARSRRDFRVVSIGGEKYDGDLDRVRSEARDAGVDDLISFMGRRDDALSFVAAADIMANPSDHEGLPLAILEAMTLGKPVVATAVGGVPSVIEDGVNGALVPKGDPDALADALAGLLDDPAARERLGGRAGVDAAEHHGLGQMVAKVEALYEEVLAGSGS